MRRAWGVLGLCLLVTAAACGGGKSKSSTSTSLRSTTTTIAPLSVTVTPPSGGVGTVFTFKVQGFESGEHLHFEVVFPNNSHTYVGQSHPVNADGTYAAPYTATKGNPLGTYAVKAIGDQGSTAQGSFELTSGPAATGGGSTATSNDARTTTTTKAGTGDTLPGD
jgi:hypothetical protein